MSTSTFPPVPLALDPAMTTTAFELPGYRVVANYGVVRGIVVRSRNIFASIGAGLQTLVGGDITVYEPLREDAPGLLRDDDAARLATWGKRGDAVRYDATEVMTGVTEVLAYGTAVFVEKL